MCIEQRMAQMFPPLISSNPHSHLESDNQAYIFALHSCDTMAKRSLGGKPLFGFQFTSVSSLRVNCSFAWPVMAALKEELEY